MSVSRNPITGMVYRGTDRVHISDGYRADVGRSTANFIDATMRSDAVQDELLTVDEAWHSGKKLCPGCYMTALFNAARELALSEGQSLSELGRTMSAQFAKLIDGDTGAIEEVEVLLDQEAETAVDGEPVEDTPVEDTPVAYISDFGPNPYAPERDYGFVVGAASYGLDVGLLR